jgi:hypothetical protein
MPWTNIPEYLHVTYVNEENWAKVNWSHPAGRLIDSDGYGDGMA